MVKKVDLKWYNIMTIALTIFAIFMVLWRVLGNSPLDIQVLIPAIFAAGGWMYTLNREVGEIKIGMGHSFRNVKDDIGSIKNDIGEIKKLIKKVK